MFIINRSVAIIRPKQPFVDWTNSIVDEEQYSVNDFKTDCSAMPNRNTLNFPDGPRGPLPGVCQAPRGQNFSLTSKHPALFFLMSFSRLIISAP